MLKILIVEDEYNSRMGLVNLITKLDADYDVVGYAENGYEGMLLAREHRPDVIITDIQMPRMSGLEMITHLREAEMNCRIIILSGYAEFEYAQRGIALGVTDYLLKPITVSALRVQLQKIKDERYPAPRVEETLPRATYSLLVSKIVQTVEQQYREKLTLEAFATRFSVTPEYLSSLFSKEVGTPFVNYLKEYRVAKAKKLLRAGGRKVYEVAYDVGYPDVKYFCRVFKDVTGLSPRQYTQDKDYE